MNVGGGLFHGCDAKEMEMQGNHHQHRRADEPYGAEGRQQNEMAEMRNAPGRNGLGLRERLGQIGRRSAGSSGIPGLRSESWGIRICRGLPGPRIGTWGTRIWCGQWVLFRLVSGVFLVAHGSTVFFLRE